MGPPCRSLERAVFRSERSSQSKVAHVAIIMNLISSLLPGDRLRWLAVLIVACFVAVLLVQSQSAASYPTYLIGLIMLFSVRAWRDLLSTPLLKWTMVLLVWLSLSVFWSDHFSWRDALSIWTRAVLVAAFVIALAECQLRGEVQRWLRIAMTFAGALVVLAALINFFVTQPEDGRLNGLGQLDTHVIAALVYGVIGILVLQQVVETPAKSLRWLGCIVLALIMMAIYLSDSRNAWVSTVLGIGTLMLSYRVRDARQFISYFASFALMLTASIGVMLLNDDIRAYLLPRGLSFRPEIWLQTLDKIAESSWLLGAGILTIDEVRAGELVFDHPHNMYLALMFQGGFIALGLFLVVTVISVAQALREYALPSAKLALSVFVLGLSAFLLDGHELVDKIGEAWFLYWLPVGVCLGLSIRAVRE